jgi:hypothetical protein
LPPNVRVLCSCLSLPATASRLLSAFAERGHEEFSARWLDPRAIDELPWQLAQLGDWPRLRELLGDLTFFDAAWQANEVDVRTAWSLLKEVGGLDPLEAFGEVLEYPAIHDREALAQLGAFLQKSGDSQAALSLWAFLGNQQLDDPAGLLRGLGNQATIRQAAGDAEGAMRA